MILGVANDHSIAWAIAKEFHNQGAELALTYPNEAIEKRLRPLAESIGVDLILRCDVTRDEEITASFESLRREWGSLDILVHSVAFALPEDLRGRFIDTSRQGFHPALDVSAYSLVAVTRAAEDLLAVRNGSVLTLSYFGAEKVIPHYNVMGIGKAALEACVRYLAHDLGTRGIRVNAISAGPLRTLSSAGVKDFKSMLHHHREHTPLQRNITAEEVAAAAVFLCGNASAVTGEVLHVDAGYNIMGI